MTTTLFAYPENAAFGRVLPKSKIYQHAEPTTAIKSLFVRQVEQIVWQFKLAPETININGTPAVPEIQVFSITLREGTLKEEVLRCIDEAIPSPILFELRFNGRIQSIAAYKRPSAVDSAKWVISEYFASHWLAEDLPRNPLPLVFDLEALYGRMITALMPYPARPSEDLATRVERMERILLKQRELVRCETRLRNEKQFNRKIIINAELRDLKREFAHLTHPL